MIVHGARNGRDLQFITADDSGPKHLNIRLTRTD